MNAPTFRLQTSNFKLQLVVLPVAVVALSPSLFRSMSFDDASVAATRSTDSRTSIQALPDGRFIATNVTLSALIQDAYQVQRDQLEQVPAWDESQRFDINAKGNAKASVWQIRLMLRALLAARFRLGMHSRMRAGDDIL